MLEDSDWEGGNKGCSEPFKCATLGGLGGTLSCSLVCCHWSKSLTTGGYETFHGDPLGWEREITWK